MGQNQHFQLLLKLMMAHFWHTQFCSPKTKIFKWERLSGRNITSFKGICTKLVWDWYILVFFPSNVENRTKQKWRISYNHMEPVTIDFGVWTPSTLVSINGTNHDFGSSSFLCDIHSEAATVNCPLRIFFVKKKRSVLRQVLFYV